MEVITHSQKRNMRALELLEQEGNNCPTQTEIDEAERLLIVATAAFRLTDSIKNQKTIFSE